jgi:hypothetical protein
MITTRLPAVSCDRAFVSAVPAVNTASRHNHCGVGWFRPSGRRSPDRERCPDRSYYRQRSAIHLLLKTFASLLRQESRHESQEGDAAQEKKCVLVGCHVSLLQEMLP